MTTERIPGGWITRGKSFPSPAPMAASERADAWLRMKMLLWAQSFPPRSAMTLIGVDLALAAQWPPEELRGRVCFMSKSQRALFVADEMGV